MDVWSEIDAERKELLTLLEGLDEAQWEAQSLCSEWKVRHVVAHLVAATEASLGGMAAGMLKNGFNLNRFLAREAQECGSRPVPELLEQFRSLPGRRSTPPVVKAEQMLADTVTHHQDIRRAVGVPRDVPAERLQAAAQAVMGTQPVLGAKKRVRGLTLRATDTGWTAGQGPEVSGTMEALFMCAVMGRRQPLDELGGPGKETLAARL